MTTQALASFRASKLALRLGFCAATLAGTAGMVADASAAIVTFTPPGGIAVTNSFDGLYVNALTGATGATGGVTPGWDINLYNSGTSLSFFWSATPSQASGVASSATGPYLALTPGAVISSASTFAQVTATANTLPFQALGAHVLGFRFYNENTSAINYGYMTLTTGGPTGFPLTINGWSFQNDGTAITVVPEPATSALLAMGGLAVAALGLRRARRTQREEQQAA